jgi:hypothetical protein
MTAAAWIAIAAIIAAFANSWFQNWLRERSERAKLATAKPAVNHPNAETQPVTPVTFWGSLKQRWRMVLIHYVATWLSISVILSVIFGTIPLNFNSVVLSGVSVVLLILVNVLPFGKGRI